jgi:hypothetical protein
MRDQSKTKKPRGRASKAQQRSSNIPITPDAAAPRGTPAITTVLRRGARQRRSTLANPQQEELLPPELLQLVGGTLSGADLAAASLVCKLWSRSLRGGTRLRDRGARASVGGVCGCVVIQAAD